jgi:hypothetical protein
VVKVGLQEVCEVGERAAAGAREEHVDGGGALGVLLVDVGVVDARRRGHEHDGLDGGLGLGRRGDVGPGGR